MEPLTDAQLTNLLKGARRGPTYWVSTLKECFESKQLLEYDIKIKKDHRLNTQDVWVGHSFYFEFLTKKAAEVFAVQLILIRATL